MGPLLTRMRLPQCRYSCFLMLFGCTALHYMIEAGLLAKDGSAHSSDMEGSRRATLVVKPCS